MKVKELIEQLSNYEPNDDVYLEVTLEGDTKRYLSLINEVVSIEKHTVSDVGDLFRTKEHFKDPNPKNFIEVPVLI